MKSDKVFLIISEKIQSGQIFVFTK